MPQNLKLGLLATLGGSLLMIVVLRRPEFWWTIWPALSLFMVGAGYLCLGPRVFGKRNDGTLSWVSTVVLGPYLATVWVLWRLLILLRDEAPYHQLTDQLIIGRRLFATEVPDDCATILDLTCEFPEPPGVRNGRDYVSWPILDGGAPSATELLDGVEQLGATRGPLYIHCAAGHGRTALVAVLLLVARGAADSAEEGLQLARAARPGVRLSRRQRYILSQAVDLVKERGKSG